MLARAGHDVVLIGRPQNVEAVEREGLRLETQTFDERIRVSASTEGRAVQSAQLVLFCVKSTDTEAVRLPSGRILRRMRWCCRYKTASRTRTDCARCCHRKWPRPSRIYRD
jgi:hypothetical protein